MIIFLFQPALRCNIRKLCLAFLLLSFKISIRVERGGKQLKVEDDCDMLKEMDFSWFGSVDLRREILDVHFILP